MNELNDLINRYNIKKDRTIKKICTPLKECLGIPIFTYYSIESDGSFGTLSTCPEQLEFYYAEKLYLSNPYMNDPQLLRSGYVLTKATDDPFHLEVSHRRFQIRNLFLMLQRNGTRIEGFVFGDNSLEDDTCMNYIHNLELLKKFTNYFKREASDLIQTMLDEGYNLKQAKGNAFLERDSSLPLSCIDPKTTQFLKAIFPLSSREMECLHMFQQGHSAQSTAALLGLSQRTVEHYFENIKDKMGCNSKRDLLDL